MFSKTSLNLVKCEALTCYLIEHIKEKGILDLMLDLLSTCWVFFPPLFVIVFKIRADVQHIKAFLCMYLCV